MNNDLHLDNIFVARQMTRFVYETPKSCTLDTNVAVTILDWDAGSIKNDTIQLRNTSLESQGRCRAFGQCNHYRLDYDWVFFLHTFFYRLEEVGHPKAFKIRSWFINYARPFVHQPDFGNVGENARRGRSCVCRQLKNPNKAPSYENPCVQCELKRDPTIPSADQFMKSPLAADYLQFPSASLKIKKPSPIKQYRMQPYGRDEGKQD